MGVGRDKKRINNPHTLNWISIVALENLLIKAEERDGMYTSSKADLFVISNLYCDPGI